MRTFARLAFVPVALFALACADASGSEDLSEDLRHDLEMASGVGLDLAAAQGSGQEIVSALETAPGPTIRRAPGVKPTKGGQKQPVVVPSVGEELGETPSLAELPASVTDSAPAPAFEPVVARPMPVAVNFPANGRDGGGWGDGRSGGGVVIRGGSTGIDHCERHPRGRTRPPVLINNRFPGTGIPGAPRAPFPTTGSTFPRY